MKALILLAVWAATAALTYLVLEAWKLGPAGFLVVGPVLAVAVAVTVGLTNNRSGSGRPW